MTAAFVELRMKMVDLVTRRGWEPDSSNGEHRWSKAIPHPYIPDHVLVEMDAEITDAYCIERRLMAEEYCLALIADEQDDPHAD